MWLFRACAMKPLSMAQLPKFPRVSGNRGRRRWWWRQILNRKWNYSRFVLAQGKIRHTAKLLKFPRRTGNRAPVPRGSQFLCVGRWYSSGHRMNSVYAILPAAGRITDMAALVMYPVNSLEAGSNTDSFEWNVQYHCFSHVLKKVI